MNDTNPLGRQGIAAAPVSQWRSGKAPLNRPARQNRCSDADPRRGGLKVRRWRARCGDGRLLGTGVTDAAIADATWRVVTDASGARSWDRRNVGPSGHSISIWKKTDRSLGGHREGGTVGWDMLAGVIVASTSVARLIRMIAAAPRSTARLSAYVI
jgi:hypothetical protein